MPETKFEEFKRLVKEFKVAASNLVTFLDSLKKSTKLEAVGLTKCDPIIDNPDPPDILWDCKHPLIVPGRDLTVLDYLETARKLEAWIKDIDKVTSRLQDPGSDLEAGA
jgi:hypothetical protein